MSEFKGTKGNWEVQLPNHIGCINVIFGDTEMDGYVELWYHHSSMTEAKANAQLIAHAPQLLEELKIAVKALKTVSSFGASKPIIERWEQLIQQATTI